MQQQAQTAVQARRAWENSRRDLRTMNERTMGSFLWKQMPRQDRLSINRGGGGGSSATLPSTWTHKYPAGSGAPGKLGSSWAGFVQASYNTTVSVTGQPQARAGSLVQAFSIQG